MDSLAFGLRSDMPGEGEGGAARAGGAAPVAAELHQPLLGPKVLRAVRVVQVAAMTGEKQEGGENKPTCGECVGEYA